MKEVKDHYFKLISGIISKYGLAWLKLDFNFGLSKDPYHEEFRRYYDAFYSMLKELGEKHNEVFFEGCASGGLRMDLNGMECFDGHFISDNVNPKDVLRITQGALIRIPPGHMTKWAVLRSVNKTVARYGIPLGEVEESIITPGNATWENAEIADVDFTLKACLMGIPGISGDIAGLPEACILKIRQHLEFFKKYRAQIQRAKAYLLTPVKGIGDNKGWAAFQLVCGKLILLYAFRLDDPGNEKRIFFKGLGYNTRYSVKTWDSTGEELFSADGNELTRQGMVVNLSKKYSAGIYIIGQEKNNGTI